MSEEHDLVVIGAGPGGYVAAIRAAQRGMKVAVVEDDKPGGVCLNWGCIPSKAILTSAELYDEVRRRGADHGLQFTELHVDYGKIIARSRRVARRLAKGVESLLRKNQVQLVKGHGKLTARHEVVVTLGRVESRLEAEHVLLATGSREKVPPGIAIDGEVVVTSRQALESKQLPKSVVVIGGGPIGLEFAYIYSSLGSAVTILEMEDQLLPGVDTEISRELERQLDRRGVAVETGTRLEGIERGAHGARLESSKDGKATRPLEAETVLVAIGRAPSSAGLGLEEVGIRTMSGFVQVDASLRTNIESIFAIGDLIGPPLLAHKASAEGIVAVDNMLDDEPRSVDYARIPACVYGQPEVAVIGLSEEQARARGHVVKIGKIPFAAIGKAVASGHSDGFAKLVVDEKYGEILGCHMIGKGATDLIGEVAVAMTLEATTTEIAETVHAHPTLSEAIMESALAAEGRAINF